MGVEHDRLPEATTVAAVGSTSEAAKKRDAAPDWSEIRDKFDRQGGVATLNDKGQTIGYTYPRSDDPEVQRRINQDVYDLWDRHRRVGTEIGAEKSARTEKQMVRVKTGDGNDRLVHPEQAEKVDRIASTGRIRSLWTRKYSEAPYWKAREERNGG